MKYFKETKLLKSLQKAEVYLEPKRVSTMELFCKNTQRFTIFAIKAQALSEDFQRAWGKMHAQVLLGVRRCAMSIFLFLKLYNFDKGIMCVFKKPKTNVFKCHLLTF